MLLPTLKTQGFYVKTIMVINASRQSCGFLCFQQFVPQRSKVKVHHSHYFTANSVLASSTT
jgi:hypothetical protein